MSPRRDDTESLDTLDILDDYLERQGGTVLINFWEEYADACATMEEIMSRLEQCREAGIQVLRLQLSEHRDWAERFRIMGTPSLLIFRDGKLVARLRGRVDYETVIRKLRQAGLSI